MRRNNDKVMLLSSYVKLELNKQNYKYLDYARYDNNDYFYNDNYDEYTDDYDGLYELDFGNDNEAFYEGYYTKYKKCDRYYDIKNKYITVPVDKLQDDCTGQVEVQCDNCEIVYKKSYKRYLKEQDKYCGDFCSECKQKLNGEKE